MRGLLLIGAVLTWAGCAAEPPEPWQPTRWPTRCTAEIVPFIPPLGFADQVQKLTFHFRANYRCNVPRTTEPVVTVELKTPSNAMVPIESVQTGRVSRWLGEPNVLAIEVVAAVPADFMVRAFITLDGVPFTRDVYLLTQLDPTPLALEENLPGCPSRWDLSSDEQLCVDSFLIPTRLTYRFPQGRLDAAKVSRVFASNSSSILLGGSFPSIIDRRTHLEQPLSLPQYTWVLSVAAFEDELLLVQGGQNEQLVRAELDGGLTTIAPLTHPERQPFQSTIDLVTDGESLLIGYGGGESVYIERRSRAALASPGPTIVVPGAKVLVGDHRLWTDDGHTVTAFMGDGGSLSIERPAAGSPLYWTLVAVGPRRPMFVVPTQVDVENPYDAAPVLWLPVFLPDGGLGPMVVPLESSVTANEQRIFVGSQSALIPTP